MTPVEQFEARIDALEAKDATRDLRIIALETEFPSMKAELRANTAITSSIKADTADIIDFVIAMRGLTVVVKWIGRILQWMAPIALVVVSAWAALKGVKQP